MKIRYLLILTGLYNSVQASALNTINNEKSPITVVIIDEDEQNSVRNDIEKTLHEIQARKLYNAKTHYEALSRQISDRIQNLNKQLLFEELKNIEQELLFQELDVARTNFIREQQLLLALETRKRNTTPTN